MQVLYHLSSRRSPSVKEMGDCLKPGHNPKHLFDIARKKLRLNLGADATLQGPLVEWTVLESRGETSGNLSESV